MFEKVLKENGIIQETQNMIIGQGLVLENDHTKQMIHASLFKTQGGKEIHRRYESLLPCLVDKLGTFTNIPDQEVIKQDSFKEDEQE